MPRTNTTAPPAAAPAVHVVDPHGVYNADTFRRAFGLRASSLRREVREGRLKVHKRCGKYFILGEDVLAWLRVGESGPGQRTPAEPSERPCRWSAGHVTMF